MRRSKAFRMILYSLSNHAPSADEKPTWANTFFYFSRPFPFSCSVYFHIPATAEESRPFVVVFGWVELHRAAPVSDSAMVGYCLAFSILAVSSPTLRPLTVSPKLKLPTTTLSTFAESLFDDGNNYNLCIDSCSCLAYWRSQAKSSRSLGLSIQSPPTEVFFNTHPPAPRI